MVFYPEQGHQLVIGLSGAAWITTYKRQQNAAYAPFYTAGAAPSNAGLVGKQHLDELSGASTASLGMCQVLLLRLGCQIKVLS